MRFAGESPPPWSALCDFMTPSNSYPLAVERLVPAKAKCPYYPGFRWAEPSYMDLRRLMRHVYQNQEKAGSRATRVAGRSSPVDLGSCRT